VEARIHGSDVLSYKDLSWTALSLLKILYLSSWTLMYQYSRNRYFRINEVKIYRLHECVLLTKSLSQRKLYNVLFTKYYEGERKRANSRACIMYDAEDEFQSQNLK
jgi:hypothetical protein